jgi:hypothetical protein
MKRRVVVVDDGDFVVLVVHTCGGQLRGFVACNPLDVVDREVAATSVDAFTNPDRHPGSEYHLVVLFVPCRRRGPDDRVPLIDFVEKHVETVRFELEDAAHFCSRPVLAVNWSSMATKRNQLNFTSSISGSGPCPDPGQVRSHPDGAISEHCSGVALQHDAVTVRRDFERAISGGQGRVMSTRSTSLSVAGPDVVWPVRC